MKYKLITKLFILGLVSSSITIFSCNNAYANNFSSTSSIQIEDSITTTSECITPRTAYDWWVYNLGVDAWGISQIKGPMSGGSFNTESAFGSNRTFTISWSGAASNAKFKIKAIGADNGNSGSINYSATCTGSSGSITLTIPTDDRGVVKLYVDSYIAETINIGSLHVDSR